MTKKSPQQQLTGFLARYTPEIAAQARAVRARMLKRLPGAVELVYDNYNALVIGYGSTERASEAVFSIVLYPRWVSICFINGAKVPDPHKVLRGSGKQVRGLRLESAADLDKPAVREVMAQALEVAGWSPDEKSRSRLVIKSISAKQRPRRPA